MYLILINQVIIESRKNRW